MGCDDCGVTLATGDVSRVGRRSVLCPACGQTRAERDRTRGHLLILGLVALSLAASTPPADLLRLVVALTVGLAAHEVAHAVVAVLTGSRLLGIVIGDGAALYSGRIGSISVRIGALPIGGAVLSATRHRFAFRLRAFLVAGAGVGANGLLVWLAARGGPLETASTGAQMTALVNGLLVASNLIPRTIQTADGRVRTDGLAMMRSLVLPRAEIDEMLATYDEAVLEHGHHPSRQADRPPPDLAGQPALAQFLTAGDWLRQGRLDDALAVLDNASLADELGDRRRVQWANNVAWALLLRGRKEDRVRALDLAQEAANSRGWSPAVAGTLGLALLELDRLDEAIPLLRRALGGARTADDRATSNALLARAEARSGDLFVARHHAQLARSHRLPVTVRHRLDAAMGRAEALRLLEAAAAPGMGAATKDPRDPTAEHANLIRRDVERFLAQGSPIVELQRAGRHDPVADIARLQELIDSHRSEPTQTRPTANHSTTAPPPAPAPAPRPG